MNRLWVIVIALSVSIATGCMKAPDSQATDELNARVEALENEVASLKQEQDQIEKKVSDVRLKGRISSNYSVFGSPLEQFFQAAEFWENTYDSALADCQARCIDEIKPRREACEEIEDASERINCFKDASAMGQRCHQECMERFPPELP
jgi:outer membrane murein-binding lipoprotein Lpp